MKTNKLILFVLVISMKLSFGQSDFRPGYIIKNQNDTVYGEIAYQCDLFMSSSCHFKDSNNIIVDYSPNDIVAYRFIDNKYFISREVNYKKVFLECLVKGEVSFYYMRDEDGDHYYIEKEGEKFAEIPYSKGFDNDLYQSKYKRHTGLLTYYMQDAPELKSEIQSLERPEQRNLIKLAEDYHNAVCNGRQCIIYEKKQLPFKVNIEVISGVVNFTDGDKSNFSTGFLAHFWLPRANEKLYLKVGYRYIPKIKKNKKFEDEFFSYTVPFHLGFLALDTHCIRPSFSVGLFSPSYSGGVIVKVSKNINLGVQGWLDFSKDVIPWIPEQLGAYSLYGSLYIDLNPASKKNKT